MIIRQFCKYAIVGVLGFIVDAGILHLLLEHLNPYYSRLISFLSAVIATWILNRHYVFNKNKSASREGCAYLIVQSVGFLVNFIIYSILVYYGMIPLPALAIAAGVSLISNFLGSKFIAFKQNIGT